MMTKLGKMMAIGAAVLTISAMSLTAFAATGYSSPAEIAAGLTGKTIESVTAQKAEEGKTYGQIADEAGKLEAFKTEMLELKKAQLAELVKEGKITQERADEIIAAMEANMEICDGTGASCTQRGSGMGMGRMNGTGRGMGAGRGRGLGGGSCLNQ